MPLYPTIFCWIKATVTVAIITVAINSYTIKLFIVT